MGWCCSFWCCPIFSSFADQYIPKSSFLYFYNILRHQSTSKHKDWTSREWTYSEERKVKRKCHSGAEDESTTAKMSVFTKLLSQSSPTHFKHPLTPIGENFSFIFHCYWHKQSRFQPLTSLFFFLIWWSKSIHRSIDPIIARASIDEKNNRSKGRKCKTNILICCFCAVLLFQIHVQYLHTSIKNKYL